MRGALPEAVKNALLIICFGGDGTILHTARMAAPFRAPILGVNMGRMGFIAELERRATSTQSSGSPRQLHVG
jgi:NAD+ kinase